MVKLKSFSFKIKNPKKEKSEDAFFICEKEGVFGVADGVGGLREKGIDPGVFAEELMANCKDTVKTSNERDPMAILKIAYAKIRNDGGATVCIVSLMDNSLNIFNFGDTKIILVRNEKIYFSSKEKTHSFNYPYQLGKFNDQEKGDKIED